MYTDNNNKGFRLKGTLQLKNIDISSIGTPSSTAYTLQYTYTRHSECS